MIPKSHQTCMQETALKMAALLIGHIPSVSYNIATYLQLGVLLQCFHPHLARKEKKKLKISKYYSNSSFLPRIVSPSIDDLLPWSSIALYQYDETMCQPGTSVLLGKWNILIAHEGLHFPLAKLEVNRNSTTVKFMHHSSNHALQLA